MTLAITMGDPAGIGPEIIVRLFAEGKAASDAIVIGDLKVLERVAGEIAPDLPVIGIAGPGENSAEEPVLPVLQVGELADDIVTGRVDARCGAASFDYVRKAIGLALERKVSGIVTAPIHKEALSLAGVPYPGHTEMLADLTGTDDFAMMLANDSLKVILTTIHVALRDVPALITIERVRRTVRLACRACEQLGIVSPRVAVAGLNPHAGEHGLFGDEDDRVLRPVVEEFRNDGHDVSGPWPGDTVFMRARRGEFDIVVAQYHDQGLIPVKLLGIDDGVNVTVGLPFIRTSVDHGTAFDIAGKGIADHASLVAAFEFARRFAPEAER